MKRDDGREAGQLRPVTITLGAAPYAEGSALVEAGGTRVLCAATVQDTVPQFLKGKNKGWVTAEYSMLPRATQVRTGRERKGAGGRTMEIQRLIGRSLRSVVEMALLGERSVIVDCDVLQADGGTRTMAITGAYVAMHSAMETMVEKGMIARNPALDFLASVSVGVVQGVPMLDLCYVEDRAADVDMNVVMTAGGKLVEVQGTAEKDPFSRDRLNELLDLASSGIEKLVHIQRTALKGGN